MLDLVLGGIILSALAGILGLLPGTAQARIRWTIIVQALGSALGLAGAGWALAGSAEQIRPLAGPWPMASMAIGLDSLSAWFLVPVFGSGILGAIYAKGYWNEDQHPSSARPMRLFWGFLVAAMGVVVIARHWGVLLFAWEAMALSGYFLISGDDDDPKVRSAGWLYLICAHAGLLALVALMGTWQGATGGLALAAPTVPLAGRTQTWVFALAVLGFGLKAGLIPLHIWLPSAHANAPSHVSAVLSGVMIKMGVYGLVRMLVLVPDAPAWMGLALLGLGAISAIAAMAFALAQKDLKRILAYSSIENIGIIAMGLGLWVWARAHGMPTIALLGLLGAMLHVWNHWLFKSILFLGAGSVIHAAHTRDINRMGGLGKALPWTGALMLTASLAIAGLPPLNGFASELLIYLGFFRASVVPQGLVVGLGAAVLGIVGGLALACFVRLIGAVFLGTPRHATEAHEAPWSMRGPMIALAIGCVAMGLAPWAVAKWVQGPWATPGVEAPASVLAPLLWTSVAGGILLLLVGAGTYLLLGRGKGRGEQLGELPTWDCGFAGASPRIQYTASSFGQYLGEQLHWITHTHTRNPDIGGIYPKPSTFITRTDDLVLERMARPWSEAIVQRLSFLRFLQQGLGQFYVLLVVLAAVALLSLAWLT